MDLLTFAASMAGYVFGSVFVLWWFHRTKRLRAAMLCSMTVLVVLWSALIAGSFK
jgi:hypothetical protein